MPGYVIHLSVANRYIEKHPEEIKDHNKFIEGVISPDGVTDKSTTHYGPKSSKVNLKLFLESNEINDDFNKGYFLHLVTDYLFFNRFLDYFSKDIYNDYDILNKTLEEKYNVKIPEEVKGKVFYKTGETKILNLESVIEFIEKTSEYKLEYIKQRVIENDINWLQLKDLRKS